MSLSKTEFEPKITTYQGNEVRIVDPNPLHQTVPHEDLFIYVSLRAKQKSKSILTETSDTTMTLINENKSSVDLITPQSETIQGSALFKSKPNLTTDWTEIGGNFSTDNIGKDLEGFGITSIDIEIKSQQTPKVVVNFVDVRGATLFEQGSCSPYGLFFNLPYPIFELTVKGYYGRPVNYYLNLVKFNTKFNSSTGNMECTAEFIGYTFAFLSDTIVAYVAASQELQKETYNPQDKLKRKYQTTRDFYYGNGLKTYENQPLGPWCNNPAIGGGGEYGDRCTTIFDLLQQLDRFEKKDKPAIAGSQEYMELESLNNLVNDYESYYNDVRNLARYLEVEKKITPLESKSTIKGGKRARFVLTPQQVTDLTSSTGELNLAFNKINGTFLTSIKNIKTKKIGDTNIYGDDFLKNSSALLTSWDHQKLLDHKPENNELVPIFDQLNGKDWQYNVLTTTALTQTNFAVTTTTNPYIDLGWILDSIEVDLEGLNGENGEVTKKRKNVINEVNRIIESRLGFKPTIRNVFTVLLCNTDAFMEILLEVYAKAEEYHKNANYTKEITPGNPKEILAAGGSTGNKVYPWPTYFKKVYNTTSSAVQQGTKEEYPGRDFPTWWEVIFVEDFIKAYMRYQNKIDLLNGEYEDKPGYDNYVPINPLESSLWDATQPNKYYEKTNLEEIFRVIGERIFISLDHSFFQPVRLTEDCEKLPLFDVAPYKWNPLKIQNNYKTEGPDNIIFNIAKIDSWNLLNAQEGESGKKIIQVLRNYDENTLKEKIVESLTNYYVTKGGGSFEQNVVAQKIDSNVLVTPIPKIEAYGFQSNGTSHVKFRPIDPLNNSDKKVGIKMHSTGNIMVTPNPHDMDLPGADNLLFKIIDAPGGTPNPEIRKIKITQKDFLESIDGFNESISSLTKDINFETSEYKLGAKIFQASLERGDGGGITSPPANSNGSTNSGVHGYWVTSFSSPKLFTTLFMSNASDGKQSTWWGEVDTNGDLSQIPAGVMGSISYWDYRNFNEVFGISLMDENNSHKYIFNKNSPFNGDNYDLSTEGGKSETEPGDDIDNEALSTTGGDGISSPLVSTPFWLDNVNKFRTKSGGSEVVPPPNSNLTSEEVQNANLAYIYLHSLKMTPFISRFTTDDGYLFDETDKKDTNTNSSSPSSVKTASYIQSLRALMITSGLSKVPKAWLLTLGAQLWRWKMFVGTNTDPISKKTVWNKPLTCINCLTGDIINGFDPLAQPGYNSLVGNPTVYSTRFRNGNNASYIERNHLPKYIATIYGIGSNRAFNLVQKSVFDREYMSVKNYGHFMGDFKGENTYAAFRYFNIYRDRMGLLKDGLRIVDDNGVTITENTETKKYSWAQNWIAPHHLLYINPEKFYDVGEGEGSGFVMTFENDSVSYLDYPTLMPETYLGNKYSDAEILSGSTNYTTSRSKELDGNLGMVFQYIPDEVKNIIVDNFLNWVKTEWENNILPVVDPINFGNQSTSMIGVNNLYKYNIELSEQLLGNDNDSCFLTLNGDNEEVKKIKNKLLIDQYWIVNTTPKIWYGIGTESQPVDPTKPKKSNQFVDSFLVQQEHFNYYIKHFIDSLKKNAESKIKEIDDKLKKDTSGSDNLLDDDDVRLSLYRTFKSISDKWISASKSPNTDPSKPSLFFNLIEGGGSGISCKGSSPSTDVPNIQDGSNGKIRSTLAAHFQYVNRVMGDIGDSAVIDISKFKELQDNPKISLYQYLTDVLVENNYLFFPLPAFVNFTGNGLQTEDLKDMFRPVNDLSSVSCGPLFLAMYVGGNSRQLKMTPNTACKLDKQALENIQDDSFTISSQEKDPSKSPLDTTDPKKVNSNGFTTFKVVYGLDTQNHFTNIQLDQSEFSETAESLQVIDKLSQQGGGDQTSKGQNLNAAYLTRSYTCTVESMGNTMIQPMTYFDLIGVPMFSGAYLITEVRHSFTPNNAKTTFKGSRQPRMTVPIVEDAAVAMNISFKDVTAVGSSTSLSSIGGGGTSGGAGGGTGGGTGGGSNTVSGQQGSITAPTLDEILGVMSKNKGVFYSSKAFTNGNKSGLFKDKRSDLISSGVYDPNQPYFIYTDPYVVNIVGIRNFASGNASTNAFDDILAVFYKDPSCTSCKDNWWFKTYQITTDPGIKNNQLFTTNTNKLGAGFMAEGQYVGSHTTGSHPYGGKGSGKRYLALHNGQPILVYRDNNNDDWADKNISSLYLDIPNMNIHNSGTVYGPQGGNDVENWSAGCQVFKSPKDYMEFIDIVFLKAKNTEAGGTTPILLTNDGGEKLQQYVPTGSSLKNGDVVKKRHFTYTLLNSAEFGKPKIAIGDPAYEHFIPGGARSSGAGSNQSVSTGKCTPTKPLVNPSDYKPTNVKDKNPATKGGIKWNDIKSNAQKYLWDEYAPLFETDPTVKALPKGMKILMTGQAIQEGYFPKEGARKAARAYTNKNPGNIGNTDKNGANATNTNMGTILNGTLAQAKYIYQAGGKKTIVDGVPTNVFNSKGLNYAFYDKIGKPLKIDNQKGGDKTAVCVPGFSFPILEPTLSQYLMTYATASRTENTYLNFIIGWFKYQGYTITPDTKISEIIQMV